MNKCKKMLVTLLAVCMVFVMMPATSFAADVKSDDIVVLYTNDVHSGIDDNIGYAGLAAYKAEKLKQTNHVTLVDAGDAIQGGTSGALSKGQYPIDIMNKVGYDIAVPGNHEFDYGMDRFFELVKASKAKYISSNFMDLRTDKSVFEPYVIKEYGQAKVAFVGISTPESITKSTPAYFQNDKGEYIYGFQNDATGDKLYATVQSAIDAAKKAGANYVIAIGHLGIDEQSKPWTSKEVIAKTTGLDAFIDGHSHSTIASEIVKNKEGKDVTLSSTGTKLAAIGELVISGGKISTSLITNYEAKDATVDEFIKEVNDKVSALTKKVIGKSAVNLTTMEADGKTRAIRNQETNLGDFCADAYKYAANADIGFIQGGGIRANINAGDITYGDMLAVHPWGSMLCKIEVTGQQVLDALEFATRNTPDEVGGFLQVSGITFDIDTTVPSTVKTDDNKMYVSVEGARRVLNVKVNGVAIDPYKTYTLASTNYILKDQGDGYTMFKDCKLLLDESLIDTQVLMNYIQDELGGVIGKQYEKRQGRIGVIKAVKVNSNDALVEETQVAKETVALCKDAAKRTTKVTSSKVSKRKIHAKISGNSKADGFYYKTINAKGTKVSYKYSTAKTYTTRTLAKGKYTVSVTPYTYVCGEKVYGKTVKRLVTIK